MQNRETIEKITPEPSFLEDQNMDKPSGRPIQKLELTIAEGAR